MSFFIIKSGLAKKRKLVIFTSLTKSIYRKIVVSFPFTTELLSFLHAFEFFFT